MRSNVVRRRRVGLAALVMAVPTVGTAAPAGGAASQPAPAPEVTVTDLPAGFQARDINNRGQLVGTTDGCSDDCRTVVWEDGEVTDVGPYDFPRDPGYCDGPACFAPGPALPSIDDRGQVVTYQDGHAVLWENGRAVSLGGDADISWLLDLNERGEALVARFTGGRQVVGVWRRGGFTPLQSGPLVWTRGFLSDRGHAVVATMDLFAPAPYVRASVWHRGVRRDLPEGFDPRDVNRRGQIAGIAQAFTAERYPALWADGELTRLPVLAGGWFAVTGINDRGQIVGSAALSAAVTHTVLWEDGGIADIGAGAPTRSNGPVAINDRGEVLIDGSGGQDAPSVAFLWRDGRLIPLPPVGSRTYVEAEGFNERGQIFGLRAVDNSPEFLRTLWEVPPS